MSKDGNRLYIETWGCQMNLRQSEGWAGIMVQSGFTLVDRLEDADVVLFNGCMVRQKAEEKVYGRIGAVVQEKRKRKVLLGIGGCLGQVRAEALLERFRAVDLVFGSSGYANLPDLIRQAQQERFIDLETHAFNEESPAVRASQVTAKVTITEGCSNFCTYCVVPFARGPMRSRPRKLVIAEVKALLDEGYREVLLLGQNVNAYGSDQQNCGDFPNLLRAVSDTGIARVRFTTSHPRDMSNEIVRVMKDRANVCPHLHLACQSGSDRILQAMNRGYTSAHFLHIVEEARTQLPDLNVTTDIIVGFPGETEEDFERTLDLVESARFGTVFAAKYSPRPLTKGRLLVDDVTAEVKARRLEILLDRQREIALALNQTLIGSEREILVEGRSKRGGWYGRTGDHRTVMVDGDAEAGSIPTVRIEGASAASLGGSILVRECAGGTG